MIAQPYPGPPKPSANLPSDPAAGVNLTPQNVADVVGVDLTKATRLLAVGKARVEREAPSAPESVSNESVYLFAAYLKDQGSGALRSKQIGGDTLSWEFATNNGLAFRNCGAKALLAPWKVRRGRSAG